ncbi:MAG: TolC family protein [Terriglobales bacterium]
MPSPLRVEDVLRLARERRAEVAAARARIRAASERPAIVSALEDPMVAPALDHLPFRLQGADFSLFLEQRFPLSRVRKHRRQAAEADLERTRAEADRTVLDVAFEAAASFYMLHQRRESGAILEEQIALARQVVSAANARYAGGTGTQSDVLQAEVAVARLIALSASVKGEVRAAEAMLNTSLGRGADEIVPALDAAGLAQPVPAWSEVMPALEQRPELVAGRADIKRAASDVQVMRDMFKPMLTVRTGPAYTMSDGAGAMLMVGVSLPIWRGKLRAGVAEAEAMREMVQADLQAMGRIVVGQAAAARHQVQAAQIRHQKLRTDVVPRARYAIDTALASYAAGRVPLVSVLAAVQALWAAQMDVIEAEAELGMAWARLHRAIGTNLEVTP